MNLVVTIPVDAGNYKVTLGTCQYGTGTGDIKDAGSSVLANFNQKAAACYDAAPETNIVSATFSVSSAQKIVVTCGNYTPYFAFEKLAEDKYTISFKNETSAVDGTVPALVEVAKGESFTIPFNRTLYKEGYTLTGWTDGTTLYTAGLNFVPESDLELTTVFTKNDADLLTAQEVIAVEWHFLPSDGAPNLQLESNSYFLVAQAVSSTFMQDVRMVITAYPGKFDNVSNSSWAQVNPGTMFSFPSKPGTMLEVYSYAEPSEDCNLDGTNGSFYTGGWTDNVATFTTEWAEGTSDFTSQRENQYFRWMRVTLPASTPTGMESASVSGKAVKVIENNRVVILHNGIRYSVLGAEIR